MPGVPQRQRAAALQDAAAPSRTLTQSAVEGATGCRFLREEHANKYDRSALPAMICVLAAKMTIAARRRKTL
jgi:hypothetical protein